MLRLLSRNELLYLHHGTFYYQLTSMCLEHLADIQLGQILLQHLIGKFRSRRLAWPIPPSPSDQRILVWTFSLLRQLTDGFQPRRLAWPISPSPSDQRILVWTFSLLRHLTDGFQPRRSTWPNLLQHLIGKISISTFSLAHIPCNIRPTNFDLDVQLG